MDTVTQMTKRLNNRRGFALVWVALVLPIILLFSVLAVDVGYLYMAKGQLQNAADAAALAGAAKLDYSTNPLQAAARVEAIKFAEANKAARASVGVANDNSNDFADGNDIRFGYWNGSDFLLWGDAGIPATVAINAIQVRTRRTAGSPGGQVAIHFGKLFGWDRMSASAVATAALIPRANSYTSLCADACAGHIYTSVPKPADIPLLSPARVLQTGTTVPSGEQMAWTSLDYVPSAPGFSINDLICGNTASAAVCGQQIYSSMGQASSVFKKLESVFYDPLTPKEGTPAGWWAVMPVTQTCPPGAQGNAWDPKAVAYYALVHVIRVCATGGGQGCPGRPAASNDPACKGGENSIVIDRIACVSCANPSQLFGLSPLLVK